MPYPHRSSPHPAAQAAPSLWTRRHVLAGMAALPLAPVSTAWAQTYPERPITLVVPNAAGGALDSLARSIADELGKHLKQSIVVDNQGGASGAIAAQKVLRAQPDGYTLLFGSTSDMVVTPVANRQAGYVPGDFLPIARVGTTPMCLVARPGLPVKSMDELAALVRKPGTSLTVGTTGTQSLQAFAAVALAQELKADFVTVPYKGGAPMMNDLLGGQLDLAAVALPSVLGQVRAGKLRMLGLLSEQRSPLLPDVPTVNESQAIKGVVIEIWAALAAPGKLPAPIAEKLHGAVMELLRDKDFSDRRMKLGDMPVAPASLEEFRRFVVAEERRFTALAPALR